MFTPSTYTHPGKNIVEPVKYAAGWWNDAAHGKHGDASAVEQQVLENAPEALGQAGGVVVGNKALAIPMRAAGRAIGYSPQSSGSIVTDTIGETKPGTVGGSAPLPFRGAVEPVIRGTAKAINTAAPSAITTGLGTAAGAALGHPALGAELGFLPGAAGTLVRGIREAVPKVPGENFGLTEMQSKGVGNADVMSPQDTVPSGGRAIPTEPQAPKMRMAYPAQEEPAPKEETPVVKPQQQELPLQPGTTFARPIQGPLFDRAAEPEPASAVENPKAPSKPTVSKIGQEVEKGMGGKPVPEDHTPVNSSAIRSYKYDAGENELHVQADKTGTVHVYGDVNDADAAKFENAESKGKAWATVKSDHPQVAKIIDGKRISVKPTDRD